MEGNRSEPWYEVVLGPIAAMFGIAAGVGLWASPLLYVSSWPGDPAMGGTPWIPPTLIVVVAVLTIRLLVKRQIERPILFAFLVLLAGSYFTVYLLALFALGGVGS